MSIKDKLQIILVTYNRERFLEDTLKHLFDKNSPVKDFDITILNNKSTDKTYKIIEKYRKKFPNINHIVNNKNIGGNANIAQAITMGNKEYLWVICDDDMYDWANWKEVEFAVSKKHDIIVVDDEYIKYRDNPYDLIFQLSFLPSGIYRTDFIDSDVIRNVYDNIIHWFPHLPLSVKIANTTKDFYVLKKPILRNGQQFRIDNKLKLSDDSWTRDNTPHELYPEQSIKNWNIAYINSLAILKGKSKDIQKAMNVALQHPPVGVAKTYSAFCKQIVNHAMADNFCRYIYYDIWYKVGFKMKFWLSLHKFLYSINPGLIMNNRGIYIKIGKFKTKIIPFKF